MRSSILAAAVLAAFWAMAISVSPRVGATSDERVHLVGGYSYWRLNDYRLQPENGNLTMRLEALPLLPMTLTFPPLDAAYFRDSSANDVGHEFLFGSNNPFDAMLWRARAMVAFIGAATLWLIWRWARSLFGRTGGWLALGTAAFSPTLLAHSGLATSDAASAAALLAAVGACWWVLHRVTWLRLTLAALATAAALLAKFSGVLLAPIAMLLLIARWSHPAPLVIALGGNRRWIRARARRIAVTLGVAVLVGVASLALVWSAYGFRYSTFNPRLVSTGAPPQLPWGGWEAELSETPGGSRAVTRTLRWAKDHHVLPEAYLLGFAISYKYSRGRQAFLMGETSSKGWPQFFPLAFLLKTPPPTLLLLLAGVAALVIAAVKSRTRKLRWPRPGWLYRSAPLLILFALYGGVALNTPLNIGHRHLLPIYPIVYIFVAAAAGWLVLATTPRRPLAILFLVGVPAVLAVESWRARPHYLAYFTPWVGGAARGWHYLVDSSGDWGQGLPDLAAWLEQKKAAGDRAPVFLTYFGTDSPEARKLPVTRFGDLVDDLTPRSFPAQVRGGWFVVSATHYQGIYLDLAGPWNGSRESQYQQLRQKLSQVPADLVQRDIGERSAWANAARHFERLQFGRLLQTLRRRVPESFIGGSLLVFRLNDAEVQGALYGPISSYLK